MTPPKKPSTRRKKLTLADVMGEVGFPLCSMFGTRDMPLDSPRLIAVIEDVEKWAASARKFIEAYKSGRLTED